jgi:N6-L-threonylcarbamoyladenine synthase
MYILGFESSCDETSAAVVYTDGKQKKILSDIIASQIETHKLYGGVVPEIASRAHIEAISRITVRALDEAQLKISDIDCIAVTACPGLIGALLVAVNFAKSLAYANNIPLVAVNHIHAHTAAVFTEYEELEPPLLSLAVSGGNTAFFRVKDPVTYEFIGGTRDDAAGEAFDKIGRVIGLPYPSGAAMDKLARLGDPNAIKLPSPALSGDTLDFSFSGLKTAMLNYINSQTQKGADISALSADIAASYTKAIVTGIAKKVDEALKLTGEKKMVLCGGVAANSHLRAAVLEACQKNGATLYMPPVSLCGDNGAMVAMQGYFEFMAGKRASLDLNASAVHVEL